MADSEQTWQTITDRVGSGPGVLVMAFAEFHADLQKYDIRHPFFAPAFLRATDLVIRAALTGQGALATALCKELSPLARAIADTAPGSALDLMDTPNLAALAVFVLEQTMGWVDLGPPVTADQTTTLLSRLAATTRFGDGQRESAVLAHLVYGKPVAAKAIADLDRLAPFFDAFLNPEGAARLWPDWRDRFPAQVRANAVFWHQMLFAIRSLAGPGQNPADWLLSQVA